VTIAIYGPLIVIWEASHREWSGGFFYNRQKFSLRIRGHNWKSIGGGVLLKSKGFYRQKRTPIKWRLLSDFEQNRSFQGLSPLKVSPRRAQAVEFLFYRLGIQEADVVLDLLTVLLSGLWLFLSVLVSPSELKPNLTLSRSDSSSCRKLWTKRRTKTI